MRYLVIAAFLFLAADANALCTVGPNGNVYSDETAEEIFVDPENHDFRLKEGSCAIDMGVSLTEVTHDFDGVKRPQGIAYDIGAFEFIPAGPVAPKDLQFNKGR